MTTDIYSPLLQFAQFNLPRQRVEVKSVWDDDAGWEGTVPRDDDVTAKYYKGVPWLYRGVEMRANAVASVPFQVVRNTTAVDTSDEWKDTTGLMPDPYRLLWLLEAALCFGPAYLWRERNRAKRLPLKYINASTITPQIDSALGLTGFVRQIGAVRIPATVDEIVYFWKPDYQVELGPPLVSPAAAALAAANVLWNLDQFTASFWARGAIRATLLTVEGAPQKNQIEELKRWWQKAVSGVKNAFAANVINASAVKPVVIGDGLDSLQNNDLTTKQREDISTALGIPFTVMNSTSAGGLGGGGVVHQDEIHFYDKTIRPECNFIAGVLNNQVFGPLGLRFEFLLDSLDVFQEDEHQRAAAFQIYVGAGLPLEVAGLMLGLELPEGWTWERITAEKEERRQEMAEQMAPAAQSPEGEDSDEDDQPAPNPFAARAMLDDLRAWRRKSQKRGKLADFESTAIPAAVIETIKTHSANGWLEALDAAIQKAVPPAQPDGIEDLVKALRDATTALGASNGHG